VATQAIYAAIIIAALARVCAAVAPVHTEVLLLVAAVGWVAAYTGFAIAFGPLLSGSKRHGLATVRAAHAR
jgi:uncharacterized protein involved in response to NO